MKRLLHRCRPSFRAREACKDDQSRTCLRLRYSEDLVDHVCFRRSKSAELGSLAPAPFSIANERAIVAVLMRLKGLCLTCDGCCLANVYNVVALRKRFSRQEIDVGQHPQIRLCDLILSSVEL